MSQAGPSTAGDSHTMPPAASSAPETMIGRVPAQRSAGWRRADRVETARHGPAVVGPHAQRLVPVGTGEGGGQDGQRGRGHHRRPETRLLPDPAARGRGQWFPYPSILVFAPRLGSSQVLALARAAFAAGVGAGTDERSLSAYLFGQHDHPEPRILDTSSLERLLPSL